MNTVTVNVAGRVEAPRGAAWAAHAAVALLRAVQRWLAPRTPAPQSSLDAARVRALARLYVQSDPGFAADLFAAADRHELTKDPR
jgi:hypothetical protein